MGGIVCIKEELCRPPVHDALDQCGRFSEKVRIGEIPQTAGVEAAMQDLIAAEEAAADLLTKAVKGCMAAAFSPA